MSTLSKLNTKVNNMITTSRTNNWRTRSVSLRANDYTLEITKVQFDWTVPVHVHLELPVSIHGKSDKYFGQ